MDLQKLRTRVEAAGLTQQDLAARLGMNRTQVWRLLNGKTRMRVDVLNTIETLLADAEAGQPAKGVGETSAQFQHRSLIPFVTLEEAKARRGKKRVRLSAEERERWLRDMKELSEIGRTLPRVSAMTDEEILGYDEMP